MLVAIVKRAVHSWTCLHCISLLQDAFASLLKSFIQQWEAAASGSPSVDSDQLEQAQLFKENCLTALAREYRIEISEIEQERFRTLIKDTAPTLKTILFHQKLLSEDSGLVMES